MNNIQNIHINTFNSRGLRNGNKRNNVFTWLKKSHPGITMLQETHAIEIDHEKWSKEWNGTIFFSDGEANSKGVATLIPKEYTESFELIEIKN